MLRTSYGARDRQLAQLSRDLRVEWQRTEQAAPSTQSALDLASEMGIALDPWQREVLTSDRRRKLCLVTRQGGKGTVATLAAIEKMIGDVGSKTIVLAPTEEQSKRLLNRIREGYALLPAAPRIITDVASEFRLINGSHVLAMPGSERSVRGIDAVDLLVVDEAALVPDELYAAVRPVLATTDGEELDLSTPHGKRGWFYQAVQRATGDQPPAHMHFVKVTAPEIRRIKPAFLANERSELGEFVYRQEYLCEFVDDETQLYATDLVMSALSARVSSFGLPTFGATA